MSDYDLGRFWSKVQLPDASGCMNWMASVDRDGYGQFDIAKASRKAKAHRFAACLAGVDISAGVVRHSCDNRRCVAPDHLTVGTQADNIADMVARGRQALGERNGTARLNVETVRDIVARFRSGERQIDIARAYGLNKGHVCNIVRGKTWSHLTGIRRNRHD